MSEQSRREFILTIAKGIGVVSLLPVSALAGDPCAIQHPIMPPNKELKGQCTNCGMVRPMWARTWITFENSDGKFQVCSFHCLAEMALKSGEDPRNVMVALYKDPRTMIPASSAFFVVGSSAKGTMTMTSKLAFGSRDEASRFVDSCGGKVMGFKDTMELAKGGIQNENQMIAKNRLKKGKIVEPVDNTDKCPVCGMYPARFPAHRCQLTTTSGNRYHFCSTQCLTGYLADPGQYAKNPGKTKSVWVTVFPEGGYEYGMGLYYLVGSSVMGPMGREALPFRSKAEAAKRAAENGGKVVRFNALTPSLVTGQ